MCTRYNTQSKYHCLYFGDVALTTSIRDVLAKIKGHTSSSKAAAASNNVPVSANTRSAAAVEREMGRPIR